jgi:hypothetical protein
MRDERTQALTWEGRGERVTGIEPAWPAWKAPFHQLPSCRTCGVGCPLVTPARRSKPPPTVTRGTTRARAPPCSPAPA